MGPKVLSVLLTLDVVTNSPSWLITIRRFIGCHLVAVELILVIVAAIVSLIWPRVSSISSVVVRRTRCIYERAWLAVTVAAVLPALMRCLILPFWYLPEPIVHDEFGYLLTADTLHSGRLSTPTHPMWRHFETPTVIHTPTYASVFPLAQSLFLLLGMWLGHAWVGVVISMMLLAAALCWMLRQWFPPRWAFFGAILFGIRFGVASYWMNSYWGGAPAAIGSALALGVLGRALHRHTLTAAEGLVLGCGLTLLANSRPFEGLGVALAGGVVFAVSSRGKVGTKTWIAAAASAFAVLVLAECFVGLYNLRVTGSMIRTPYQVSRAEYGIPVVFIWESLPPGRSLSTEWMKEYYQWNLDLRGRYNSLRGIIRSVGGKLSSFFAFYVGPIFCIPLLAGIRVFTNTRIRPLLVVGSLGMIALLLESYFFPHYGAPLFPIFLAAIVQGLRYLSTHSRWRELVQVVPGVAFLMLLIAIFVPNPSPWPISWTAARVVRKTSRASVKRKLIESGGSHIVIVHGGNHENEWVFNTANIDSAAVVWAHDLDPAMNPKIMDYYKNRQVWWISLQDSPPVLHRLSPANTIRRAPGP